MKKMDLGRNGLDFAGGRAIAPATLDHFESQLAHVWRRDNIHMDDPTGAARLVRLLTESEGPASSAAGEAMDAAGIRRRWNDVFARRRAAFLAAWVAPHLQAPVLDVLAGDCSVAVALRALGVHPIVATERVTHYPGVEWHTLPVRFVQFDQTDWLHFDAESALVCAVLHHESQPTALLDALAEGPARRWVVIENCIGPGYDAAFHSFVDIFFNRCLNRLGLECVSEHRTADGWREILGAYGTVTLEMSSTEVPGIPFPYQLFVVERS